MLASFPFLLSCFSSPPPPPRPPPFFPSSSSSSSSGDYFIFHLYQSLLKLLRKGLDHLCDSNTCHWQEFHHPLNLKMGTFLGPATFRATFHTQRQPHPREATTILVCTIRAGPCHLGDRLSKDNVFYATICDGNKNVLLIFFRLYLFAVLFSVFKTGAH